MISYEPLWETMKTYGATTYTLRTYANINGSTILRLQRNESVSTNTIDTLCKFFHCNVSDIITFIDELNSGDPLEPLQADEWVE